MLEYKDKDGVPIKPGDNVIIDPVVIGKDDGTSGRIERIEAMATGMTLVYVWHRKKGGKMELTPFNAKHLSKL
ncbi:MAG: hypothetical protein WC530_09520 [Candidatus Omnitrophota bacterium]|jgi:ribosomal protein L24